MARSQEEFQLGCFVGDTLRLLALPHVRGGHFPAGEYRPNVTGARLKRQGTPKGWPDYFIFWKGPHGPMMACLELKSRVGRLSPEQKDFRDFVLSIGGWYEVARTRDEVIGILRAWNVIQNVRVVA